jgi:hypothetical protein
MKLQVIVRLPDGIEVFQVNNTEQANKISAQFRSEGIQAIVGPVYPDRDEFEE